MFCLLEKEENVMSKIIMNIIVWPFIIISAMSLFKCGSSDSSDSNFNSEKQEWIDSEMKKADDFCARNPKFEPCW